MTLQPKIYIADLAAYHAGKLYGVWIDADQDAEAIHEQIDNMLMASPAPNIHSIDFFCVGCRAEFKAWEHVPDTCPKCKDETPAFIVTHEMHRAEGWAIHNYENFGGYHVHDYESIETISRIAHLLVKYGEPFAAYLVHAGGMSSDIENNFQDAFCGIYESQMDFAVKSFDNAHHIPDDLAPYINYEKVRRDLFTGDYWSARLNKGNVAVFRRI